MVHYRMNDAAFDFDLVEVGGGGGSVRDASTILEAKSEGPFPHKFPAGTAISGQTARIYNKLEVVLSRVNRPESPSFRMRVRFEFYCEWCTQLRNTGFGYQLRRGNLVIRDFGIKIFPHVNPRSWEEEKFDDYISGDDFHTATTFRLVSNADKMVRC